MKHFVCALVLAALAVSTADAQTSLCTLGGKAVHYDGPCMNAGAVPITEVPLSVGETSVPSAQSGVWTKSGECLLQGNTCATAANIYGCLPGTERVMRSDFSIGCAKDVQPQTWH